MEMAVFLPFLRAGTATKCFQGQPPGLALVRVRGPLGAPPLASCDRLCATTTIGYVGVPVSLMAVVGVVLHYKNPPTPCLWQAPASAKKTKKENQAGPSSERAVEGQPHNLGVVIFIAQ